MTRLAAKLLLAAAVLLAGAAALFSGVLDLAASDGDPGGAVPKLALGAVLAIGGLVALLRIKRGHALALWRAAVEDPDGVYARWTDAKGREVVFAEGGLFVDRKGLVFAEGHNRVGAAALDGGTLRIAVEAYAGESWTKELTVDVPQEHREAVRRGVARLQARMKG